MVAFIDFPSSTTGSGRVSSGHTALHPKTRAFLPVSAARSFVSPVARPLRHASGSSALLADLIKSHTLAETQVAALLQTDTAAEHKTRRP